MTDLTQAFAAFLTDPLRRADPYPFYERLREQCPVFESPLGLTFLSRYGDVERMYRSPNVSSARWSLPGRADRLNDDHRVLNLLSLIAMDGADHARLRGIISRVFSPKTIESVWRPRIRELSAELLTSLRSRGEADLIAEYAFPLPIRVICDAIGFVGEDFESYRRLSDVLIAANFPDVPDEVMNEANEAATAMRAMYQRFIEDRRANMGDDLLSMLLNAEVDGDRLSDDEIVATTHTLFVAGFETTANAIGSAVLLMLTHPDELRRLRERPELVASAVEECLRFEPPPVFILDRYTTGEVALEDMTLPTGCGVGGFLAAANRDPDVFPEPNRFDIDRSPNRHLTFAAGPHHCLGAPLARCELQEAFRDLFIDHDPPSLRSAEPRWKADFMIHSLEALPVRW